MGSNVEKAKKVYIEFMESVMKSNIDKALTMVTDDVYNIGIGKEEICKSKEELRNKLEYNIKKGFTSCEIIYDKLNVNAYEDDRVTLFAFLTVKKANKAVEVIETVSFKEIDNEYKIFLIHTSIDTDYYSELKELFLKKELNSIKKFKNLEIISENINIGLMTWDMDKEIKIEYINKKALEYIGYTLDEFREKFKSRVLKCVYKEDRNIIKQKFKSVYKERETLEFEVRVVHKSGRLIWISGQVVFIKNQKNQCVGIYSFTDITNEKKISNELRISEERFRIAFSQTKNIIFDYNISTKTVDFLESLNPYGLDKIVSNAPQYLIEKGIIHEDSIKDFKSIFEEIDNGAKSISSIIKFKLLNGYLVWNRISINIILDENRIALKGIGIIEDVTIQKEIEKKYQQEEKYRNAMLNEAIVIYEANITKNEVISGFNYWKDQFGIDNINEYDEIILKIAEKAVYMDDIKQYLEHYIAKNVISKHKQGMDELSVEYRRLNNDGEYHWVSCTTHILKDPLTGDVVSFSYLKDINEQKNKEIALKYEAERDLLTDLYNKKTTERLISEILENSQDDDIHAFMIVDLDDFKSINDKYGHIFGDAILSEIGHTLKDFFRESDVVGRIGGDEFIVFLKDVKSIDTCREKADKICKIFRDVSQGVDLLSPSGTVGVSLYPKDGKSFNKLYKKSDLSLYFAKYLGKNRFFFYDSNIVEKKKNADKKIEDNGEYKKNFENNIAEYVFKILYHAKDLTVAVESVLKLIGIHLKVDRGYIFESTKDGLYMNNTFEWCGKSIEPQKDILQNLKYEELDNYDRNFEEHDIYIVEDIKNLSSNVRHLMERQGIKSILQCAIRSKGKFIGLIGFDECNINRAPTSKEIATIQVVAEILGTFLINKRNEEEAKESELILKKLIDNLNAYTYVVDPNNYKVLFVNKKVKELVENFEVGDKCYKKFSGLDEPCSECPMTKLTNFDSVYSELIFNEVFNFWTETTASYINWVNDEKMCLINCIDVSKFKNIK